MKKILAILLWPAIAWAHGAAEWIGNAGYRDKNGAHCCGPTDCAVAAPGEIERIPGGWIHVPTGTALMDGDVGIYPSIDPQLWRCVRDGRLKCLFPGTGL